jgi:hypothetical protein
VAAASPLENDMRRFILVFFLLLLPVAASADFYAILIEGLGGLPKYTESFDDQSGRLEGALESIGGSGDVLRISGDEARRDVLEQFFEKLSGELGEDDRVAVFLVGHGSYDGSEYKFNIPGPDITGEDIRELMDSLPASRQLLVVTGSSSGALTDILERDDRTVITATRSGAERNATSFGEWFTEALEEDTADLNKNEYVTVQEAYDYAARAVEEDFDINGRLATEHSQLTGDGAVQFNLARLVPDEPVAMDSEAAELVTERAQLDERIQDLQLRRSEMSTEAYYEEIEVLMLELARIEEAIEEETTVVSEVDAQDPIVAGVADSATIDLLDPLEEIDDEIDLDIEVGMGVGIGDQLEITGVNLLEEEDVSADAGDGPVDANGDDVTAPDVPEPGQETDD